MNIHINISRIDFKINEVRNLFADRNQLFVCIHYGFMKIRMPHISPVDKEILMGTFLAGCLRFGYVSGNLHHGSIHLDIQQLLIEFLTENSHNALTQRRNRKIEKLGVIAVKGESYFGMNQSDTFKFGKDITQFGGVCFQEFTTGRDVKE